MTKTRTFALPVLIAAALLGLTACSSKAPVPEVSRNVATWKPGHAVAVLIADVARTPEGDQADYGAFMKRPGVIAVWSKEGTLRVSLSRQAMLVDLAALKLELEKTAGLSNVREVVVPPA